MTGLGKNRCAGWLELKKQLCVAALDDNNSIASNGTNGAKATRKFLCEQHYHVRKSRGMVPTLENPWRQTSMTNNRKNN